MNLVQKKLNASQVWVLTAYSLCVITMFGMQHQVWRHIVFGIAASVLLLVAALFLHAQMSGSCRASTQG